MIRFFIAIIAVAGRVKIPPCFFETIFCYLMPSFNLAAAHFLL